LFFLAFWKRGRPESLLIQLVVKQMKGKFSYSILAVAALFLSGCARPGMVEEKSVLAAMEKTKQEVQITKREELKTQQFGWYYKNRGPEAESLASIAADGGVAAEVAAAGVSSAAPPGAVFAPDPLLGRKRSREEEHLIAPNKPDPVCSWAPVGMTVCPQ
jgi:hypothetical protein